MSVCNQIKEIVFDGSCRWPTRAGHGQLHRSVRCADVPGSDRDLQHQRGEHRGNLLDRDDPGRCDDSSPDQQLPAFKRCGVGHEWRDPVLMTCDYPGSRNSVGGLR